MLRSYSLPLVSTQFDSSEPSPQSPIPSQTTRTGTQTSVSMLYVLHSISSSGIHCGVVATK